ncbi:hypothetical protein K431DRAFT_231119 [Polychaeton citri CBS 116435]|uniref:Arrestin C-terminal-like domain-containing protein n=1 Tax=Polychaeton citri CBS 116435 TaxID=1314669 RepID=A0A9P4Q4J2_9PEZI|nr:hypothetical protein K431DRAFT_231119 [Polychaeton citri CBS 116435]
MTTAPNWGPLMARPLSDIREITEPSLIDVINNWQRRPSLRRQNEPQPNPPKAGSIKKASPIKRICPVRVPEPCRARPSHRRGKDHVETSSSYSSASEAGGPYSIPKPSVPQRSSSCGGHKAPVRRSMRKQQSHHRERRSSSAQSSPSGAWDNKQNRLIPNRGPSRSPVKIAALQLDHLSPASVRKVSSRTLIRTPHPADILEYPTYRHSRVKLDLHVSAPLFVGGGSIEGLLKVTIDGNERSRHRRTLAIAGLSVDLLGFEEVNTHRKAPFLSLGTDVIDVGHPPPSAMAEPINATSISRGQMFWPLLPSASSLPFMVSLPLDTGPPPFQSKHARIRFLLAATAVIKDSGKQYLVRVSQDVHVLSTYDPEKALTSLPSPLTAKDELHLTRQRAVETLKLIAGLHRQVWVSGGSIFADIHISNKTHKPVKRLELTLERDILCYKHAAASTREKSAGQARIFESNEQAILAKHVMKHGHDGWAGLDPFTSETRTCALELPREHATVRCGKFFEVRFFLNATASLSSTSSKLVSVQIPVILIHLNSLDVLPNAVAQVAAAIEEKKVQAHLQDSLTHSQSRGGRHRNTSRKPSSSSPLKCKEDRKTAAFKQGQVFAAPRKQSLERVRQERKVIDDLCKQLDSSPRKYKAQLENAFDVKRAASEASSRSKGRDRAVDNGTPDSEAHASLKYNTPPSKRKGRNFDGVEEDESLSAFRRQLRRFRSTDTLRSNGRQATRTGSDERFTLKPLRRMQSARGHESAQRYESNPFPIEVRPHMHGAEPGRPSTGWSLREKVSQPKTDARPTRKVSQGLRDRGKELLSKVGIRDQNDNDLKNVRELIGAGRDLERERRGWI